MTVLPFRGKRRAWTYDSAMAAQLVDILGIAAIARVAHPTVKTWRNNYLREVEAAEAEQREPEFDDHCLLEPDEELTTGGVWAPPRVVAWLEKTQRRNRVTGVTQVRPGAGRPRNPVVLADAA